MRKFKSRKPKKGRKVAGFGLLLAAFISFGFYYNNPDFLASVKRSVGELFQPKKDRPQIKIKSIKKRNIVPVFSDAKLNRDDIDMHRSAAEFHGCGILKNDASLSAKISNEELVKIENGKGFEIGNMTHSFPYLVPKAKQVLEKIGLSFYTFSGDSSTFTVTSLTRTHETQNKLRSVNVNADKTTSTHCYGVSFDISYIRYNGQKDWSLERTKVLEGVLTAMQENGEIYVIKEHKQHCFHITVRN